MDTTTKSPEDMTSSELATALKNGTVGGNKPAKTTAKVADVKPKKVAAKKSKPAKAKKPAAKKSKPAKAKKADRKFGVESAITTEKLTALLKKRPHTAKELAKIFKRSAIAVKRQVAKLSGVKTTIRKADGSTGRRPNVYTLG
jgi:response regulator of citrate/malate metabolism